MNFEIDLGLDSLARAESFAALEHAFSTEFDGDEAARALTVRDAITLIKKHVGSETLEPVSTELNWSRILTETDDDLPEVRHIFRRQPLFIAFAFSVYKTFKFFCRIFLRLEVEGVDRLKAMKRPFIVCPNHQSFLDPFVVCSNYSYDHFSNTFHVGAGEFFENRFLGGLLKLLRVVPVDPDTQLMKAMKAGAIGLKHGKVLNIYPEGERAYDGDLHEFKKGAAILATELDLPIVPVAIDGLHKVWARRSMKIRFSKVKVRFGEPFYARDILSAAAGTTPSAKRGHPSLDKQGSGAFDSPPVLGGVAAASADGVVLLQGDGRYEAVTAYLKNQIASMIEEMRK
jgi:long-chain acyl-CoA synthetase